MKTSSSKSLLYFLLASLLAVSAESFFLLPQQQALLFLKSEVGLIVAFSLLLLFVSYLSFGLVFYQHTHTRAKVIGGISALALLLLVFLYLRAALYIEGLLLLFFAGLATRVLWQTEPKADWLGRAGLVMNFFLGALFLFPQFFTVETYQRALPLHWLFTLLFLNTALLKVLADRKSDSSFSLFATKLLSLPWIGWACLFSVDAEFAILIPSILFSLALLTFDLLPFEKFRLPDNKILGYKTLPFLSLLLSIFLAIFYFLLQFAVPSSTLISRFLFLLTLFLSALFVYLAMRVNYLIFELLDYSLKSELENSKNGALGKLTQLIFAPFQDLRPLSEWQAKKIKHLSEQLIIERENAKRLTMLGYLHRQLDDFHDDPVAAQLAVNTIEKYFNAALAAVLIYDIETHELSAYAVAGVLKAYVPAGYRQSMEEGTLGRAARLQKVQIINDTSTDHDYINLCGEEISSEAFVPLIHHGHLKGMLMIGAKEKNAFSAADLRIFEAVAHELLKTWERSGHNRRMRTLIRSSVSLSTSLEPQSAIEEITAVARETLLARFVFVTLLDQEGTFTRMASLGYAPNLQQYLSRELVNNPLLKAALDQQAPQRVRDVRRYKNIPDLPLDHNMLRGLMMIPIRLHGISIGAILVFGKQGGVFFSEKDESLANLLASQAAAAVESSWLIQELRSNSATTTLLYQLSVGIIQTDTIRDAARLIAETAQRLTKASTVGIILFSKEHKIETALEISADGLASGTTVPLEYVEQTITTGESITISGGERSSSIYLPIQTSLRKYGVLWIEFNESERKAAAQAQTLQTLANQAAMALERAMLLLDLRRKADELKAAFQTLENTYDQTLSVLMSALDARDRETEGHSSRVGNVACRIGREIGLAPDEITVLRRGALLHDIGKIGISDNILHKPGPLTDEEWKIMRRHPEIGAKIVNGIPFLEDTISVILHHHERWNGSGYPFGLKGEDIPITARIFAVADVFDALTSKRPYREIASDQEAFAFLDENAGILFDPKIVATFKSLLLRGGLEGVVCE